MRSTRRSTTAIASWRRSSVPEQVAQLFDEYADAYARGERPRAEEYLARAGGQADELAGLLERFVRRRRRASPTRRTVALIEAWLTGEPPLARPAREPGRARGRGRRRARRAPRPRPGQAREGEALLPAARGGPARAQPRQPKGLGRADGTRRAALGGAGGLACPTGRRREPSIYAQPSRPQPRLRSPSPEPKNPTRSTVLFLGEGVELELPC